MLNVATNLPKFNCICIKKAFLLGEIRNILFVKLPFRTVFVACAVERMLASVLRIYASWVKGFKLKS